MKQSLNVVRMIAAYAAFGIIGILALCVMMATSGEERRRTIGRMTTRVMLSIAGIKLKVSLSPGHTNASRRTLETQLPRSCVVVANHTSYLDGLILTAALPPRFAFVIKKEMSRVPLAGLLLRRIGSEFVERFDRHRGAMDARRLLRRASCGQSLVFFPGRT